MRIQDSSKLLALSKYFQNGGLPDLGKPHPKAGYRYSIGEVTVNGKLTNWRENLGQDKIIAQYRARAMFWVWFNHVADAAKAHNTSGNDASQFVLPPLDRNVAKAKAWQEVERLVTAPAKQAARFNATNETPTHKLVAVPVSVPDERAAAVALAEEKPPAPRNTSILTLHRGADRWLANLRKRMERGDLSSEYHDRADVSMKRLKELTQDYPLGDIAKPELDEIRIAIQADRNGKTLKRPTVKTELGHVKTMLLWLDGNELWPSPPRRWEKWLRPIFRNDDTDDDAGSDKQHDTYTLEELGKLYTHAGYSMRLWILCALNFAWGQKEIATARKTHWKTAEPDKRRVARYRHKRVPGSEPVPGRWQAWPETWDAAISRMQKTTDDETINPKKLAFLTSQGQPLVRRQVAKVSGKGRRYDAIDEAFEDTCAKAEVRNRGFYLLRHTGINLIDRIAGSTISDLYCQHAPRTMSGKHYLNADWAGVRRALRKLRKKLQPMFDATKQIGLC